jgi:hypothetical protein
MFLKGGVSANGYRKKSLKSGSGEFGDLLIANVNAVSFAVLWQRSLASI